MKTIIHDLTEKEVKKIHFNKEDKILSSLNCKNNCIGCFSCWIKHPKKCILNDEFSNIIESLKKSDELIIISQSRYGCYSASVKKVFERCIGYVLPHFTIRNNEIHHKSRYDNKLKLTTYFYGNIKEEDKKNLKELVKANAININTSKYKINYIKNIKELKNVYFN